MGIGAWLSGLFGGNRNVVTEVAGIFRENSENRAVRVADSRTAAQMQYSQEFRTFNRTWFDSLMDGVNRLPRPTFAFATLWFFYVAMDDPAWFVSRMVALSNVPTEMWYLLGLILTFYFGGRFQVKNQDFRKGVTQSLENLPAIVDTIQSLERRDNDPVGSADLEDDIYEGISIEDMDDNPALQDWKPA